MRHDHTKWLIHFVRDRIPEQDFPGETEEEADHFAGGEIEYDADAFYVLKTIIRLGGLIPGYSFRKGRTTIYGGHPAICATEMPIYSFASYAKEKGNSGKVSAYGIAFLKEEFYAAGGRPAIYGLSVDRVSYEKNTDYCRVIDRNVLPLEEQYRYVAYNPSASKWIDWSHEREWRWKVLNEERDYVWAKDGSGCYGPVSGLPLFKGKKHGCLFTSLRIIVWSHEEAREIQELITGFYLSGRNNYDTPFDRAVISRSRIIILEDLVSAVEGQGLLDAQTIEGIESANLIGPIVIHEKPANAEELVTKAIAAAEMVGTEAAAQFIKKYPDDNGSCGFANVVTYDVTSPLVQHMLGSGNASGPYDGRVHINVKGAWPFRQSIDYHEHVSEAMAESLAKDLGIAIWMESCLD